MIKKFVIYIIYHKNNKCILRYKIYKYLKLLPHTYTNNNYAFIAI